MGIADSLKRFFGIGQQQIESGAEPVTNSDLSRALNALAGLESRVLSETPRGKNEFAKIIQQFVEVQLKFKEFQEIERVSFAVAETVNMAAQGMDKPAARGEFTKKEIKLNEYRGAVRGIIINIGLRIKAFESQSPQIAQAMRDALRYVMNKLAAQIKMPQEHINLAKSQGAWF